MDKPWLKSYPEGMPTEIDLGERQSLIELIDESCNRYREKPAFDSFGKYLSYAEIDQHSRAVAAWLQHQGLQPGDRVAVMMPNLLQYPIALFGILRAGMVAVNTNPMYTPRELKHQLTDSGAKAVFVLDMFAHVVEEVLNQTDVQQVITTGVGDLLGFPKGTLTNFAIKYIKKAVPSYRLPGSSSFNQVLSAGSNMAFKPIQRSLDDIAFLQYTGGTTGVAKGAMLTHKNMLSNVEQSYLWLQSIGMEEEVIITALPLYHVFALTANCLLYFKIGGLNRLIANPRDMPKFVKELQRAPFTSLTGVNTLFNGLMNTPGFENTDFSKLKFTLGGGMAVQRAVAQRWREITGKPLLEAYGLTETSPAACINPVTIQEFTGSIGLPIASTECSIQDTEGKLLPTGESGELCVRGPQVMKGYWQRPEDTANTLSEDGWLRTGDVARMDENGFFYIIDRKKDMILVSGFNVYPNEVEDVLASHPEVTEVGVIGVYDANSGEAVKAVVVRRSDNLNPSELREWAKRELTGYKVPKHFHFVSELPKSNVGKILRKDLRELYGDSKKD